MTAALVILALTTPLLVGAAFYLGVIVGHRLATHQAPAGAVAEAVTAVRESVQVLTASGQTAVPTETDEYQAEMQRASDVIAEALKQQAGR